MNLEAAKKLPEAINSITNQILLEQERLSRTSTMRLAMNLDDAPVVHYLGHVELSWLFYLAAAENRQVLIFFQDKGVERLLLKAQVVLGFAPAVSPSIESIGTGGLRISLVLPPILLKRVSEMKRLGRLPPAGPEDEILVLAVGNNGLSRFAVIFPEGSRRNLKFFHSPSDKDPYIRVREDKNTDTWPFQPFEDLFLSIRKWVRDGFENAEDMSVPKLSLGLEGSHLRTIVDTLVATFRELRKTVSQKTQQFKSGLPVIDIESFTTDIVLRTTEDGNIARKDEDDPFHLLLRFRWQSYQNADHLRAAIGPPDFLVSGELLESFLNCFLSSDFEKEISRALTKLNWTLERINSFLEDLRTAIRAKNCTVFRVNRRGEVDTDIIVVQRTNGQRGWIFSGDFKLSGQKPLQSRQLKLKGNFQILYEGDREDDRVRGEFVKYFSWLCSEIQQWTKVLL